LESDAWPVPDNAVDLCVCDNVLEHVERPQAFFSECRRVLKDGGCLCLRTPNRWSYIALIASIIPNRHHAGVLRKVQPTRKEEDVFPTLYRCNSTHKLRRTLNDFGFESVVYGYEAEPSYLSFSRWAYRLGVLHQRIAPRFLRPSIFVFARIKKIS